MNKLPYLLLRLVIGTSFFGHGLDRLPKLATFSHATVAEFSKSMMPKVLVLPFSYALPIAEFTIGVLLLLGLFTRQALIGGVVVMMMLIIGSCLIEHWDTITLQIIHAGVLIVLLQFIERNNFAVDNRLRA